MPKFQVDITRTITDRYFVTAKNWEEAEDMALEGGDFYAEFVKPAQTKYSEAIVDVEEIDESR